MGGRQPLLLTNEHTHSIKTYFILTAYCYFGILSHIIHRRFMTDITKYKNVTLTKETYSHIQTLSKEVFDIPISLSKTIQYLAEKELERKKKNSHGKSTK